MLVDEKLNSIKPLEVVTDYLFFFLCLFFLNLFLRLCVAILCLLRFFPQGIFVICLKWIVEKFAKMNILLQSYKYLH